MAAQVMISDEVQRNQERSHLQECLQLSLEYDWISNCKMTEFFVNKPWKNAPSGWMDLLCNMNEEEINSLPLFKLQMRPNWPQSFKLFVERIRRVSLLSRRPSSTDSAIGIPDFIMKGMNLKKQHEVSRMVPLIHKLCFEQNCDGIVDIGCGLGYLGQLMNDKYQYKVLGVELKQQHCQGATKRAAVSSSTADVKILALNVDLSSKCQQNLKEATQEFLPGTDSMCLAGLHCCGDLTPNILSLFCAMDTFTSLVCMGCCYHKMTVDATGLFNAMPKSTYLRKIYYDSLKKQSDKTLTVYSLRLACQETAARWSIQTQSEHESHARHVGYRAVLQYYCHKHNKTLHKNYKRLATSSDFQNFSDYARALLERTELSTTDNELVSKELFQCFKECEDFFEFIEPFTMLQVMMQSVIETLILYDRIEYLREHNIHAELVPVFDDVISPRNMAIVAWKLPNRNALQE